MLFLLDKKPKVKNEAYMVECHGRNCSKIKPKPSYPNVWLCEDCKSN